jgi:peptidoglycan biosynthesis protein MviN/MurJ (putative lipid II flippase)
MSEASAVGDWKTFRTNVRLGLRSIVFIIIPLAAIIFALSSQLVGLYHIGTGRFTFEDVAEVAPVVAMWCVSLPFYASYMFIYRVFSSLRELGRFIVVDALGRVLLITLYGFFTTGFGLFSGLGLVGIPLADACVNALLCAVMLFVLRGRIGTFGATRIVLDGVKVLFAAVLAVALPFLFFFGKPDPNLLISILTVVLCGLFSLGIYYLLCRLFKVPEIALVNSIASRLASRLGLRKGSREGLGLQKDSQEDMRKGSRENQRRGSRPRSRGSSREGSQEDSRTRSREDSRERSRPNPQEDSRARSRRGSKTRNPSGRSRR